MKATDESIPEGFVVEADLCYGRRKSHPGLLEIKFHYPTAFNAISLANQDRLVQLIKEANDDKETKVIMLHGGRFFSSGSDISPFAKRVKDIVANPEEFHKMQKHALEVSMVNMLLALNSSRKPIVAVVRGAAIGIGYTLLSHVSMVYCSPEATFKTPFMESGQTPEGTSTYMFP